MFKTSKSYSKKTSHKREATGAAQASDYHHVHGANGGGPFITSPPPSVRNGSLRQEAAARSASGGRTAQSAGGADYSESHYIRRNDGQMVPIHGGGEQRHYDSAFAYGAGGQAQAFSESSAYETHEHYEKKMKKKTRGERDRRAANGVSNGSNKDLEGAHFQGNIDDIISRLTRGIGIVNEKLDLILKRIEDIEARADSMDQNEVKRIVQEIVDDLGALEAPIDDLFDDVNILKTQNHPKANDFYRQVYGLHQRRMAYLDRLGRGLLYKLGMYSDSMSRQKMERTKSVFEYLEEAIKWVRERLDRLNNMVFHEDLEVLEKLFEQHKVDNRDIQDFHQTVKECIARQAEVSAEDSHEYCELLRILESEYQQLRDLSAGRMLDLDSLIAFIRAAQIELIWIHDREDIEVSRNWSDMKQLDLPMLQNYYKQLLHEIELREKQFNDVHNQGAALINQRHPANEVIEIYLRSLQNQWDWLLGLTKCLEGHLRDALNLKSFQEEVAVIEEWIKTQTEHLENSYNRTDFTVEEGERWLRELNDIREVIQKYHNLLMSLAERSAHISPLWQRGERIRQPINVTAWCDYKGKDIEIRQGEDVTLLDNSDLLSWTVRGVDGVTAQVPSVVFRIPPPDPQLTNLLSRLAAQLDKMRKLWDRKHRMIRYNMMMSTMGSIQGWDLDTFLSYPPEQRDEIIKALNDDVNKLLAEMDPNDPLALRLKEELRRTNDHFLDLLNQSLRGPDPGLSNQFDNAISELLKKLEEAWKKLNERTGDGVPKTPEELERLVADHRAFEDALQALDSEVSNVKELYRQLPNPTPTQSANHDYLNSRWEDLWDLSRMYVERLKVLQQVLQGIAEVADIVRRHEVTLSSFDDMPAALDKLRGVHSQLLELNMVLQQQENIIHSLNKNVALLRQHVARTRLNVAHHPDVDRLENEVSQLTVRWDNVCSQVADRLKVAEDAQQTQMVYRSQYEEEIQWLDRVEGTINSLRRPEQLRPEELQNQLDLLMAEYSQLQEHTATIENINKEGGKFIREAKNYDNRLDSFRENVTNIHSSSIRKEFRRTEPQPKNGAQIVTEELEALNRRFAQLSSVILERRNQLNVLIQNWKRKQQDTFQEKCSTQTSFINQIMQELQQLPNAKTIDIDFSSPDSTSTARIELLRARENLAKYGVEIQNAMREADRLCDEGPEMLSPEQFHALKEARQKLQNQYKNMIEYTDSILKRLDVATSLLIEFTKKTTDFQTWIYARSKELESIRLRSGDPSRLNESKREAKSLHDEITRNDDALREINQLSLRIEVEVRNYIDELKRQDPNAKHPPLNAEDIQNTVQIIQRNYETLIHDSNALQQFLNKLRSLAIDYDHHLNEVNQWLSGLERQVRDSDPTVSRDPPEAQLENLVSLSQTAIASQPKIEAASQSSKELVDATAATDAHDALAQQNKMALDDIGRRFDRLNSRLNDNIDSVRAEIASKDGVHQGLENLLKWLLDAENDAKSFKILPLVIEKLKDQKYADQIKDSELNSQEKVLVDTGKQVDKLKEISPKTVLEEGLDAKFEDAQRRFVHLKRNRRGFSENLHDVIGALEEFQQKADGLNKKLARFNDDLDRTEPTDEHNMKMLEDEFAGLVDSDWSALTGLATRILSIPDVSETQHLNESMKQLEKALNRSQTRLSDKHNAGNRLTTDKAAFNQKLDQVDGMLREIEGELQTQILDISIDDQALQEQREFCGQLGESLEESRKEVEELEKLGTELLQASGVLQKRKSVDLDALEDGIGQVGKQMFAVRKRQDDAERALHDLNLKINENDDRRHNYEAKSAGFLKWLEDENLKLCERQNSMKLDGNALKTTSLEIKSADKRWREKQPELGELRALMHQLCQLAAFDSRHDEIEAVREEQRVLDTGFEELEKENNKLENKVAASTLLMTDAEFLKKWISTKSRILDICTISPEPSVISTNVKLLEMNLSELEDERPKFEKFVENAEKLALTTDMSRSDSFKNQVQQKADDVVQKWTELEKNLKDRVQDLAKIKHLGEKFDQFERQIRQNLKNCEKSVDEAAAKLDSPENISKFLTLLDQVQDDDDFRRQNKNFEEAGGEMEELLTDATLKSDVKNRVNAVQTASDELSKKIDGLRKAAQSAETQGSELTAAYNDAMDWIAAARSQVEHQPAVSADPAKLAAQIDNFSSLYRDALDKEGTMMLVKGKLTDGIQKSSNPEILRKKLEDLTRQWDPLLQSIKDRKQAMDSVKKLTDDLGDVEVDVKNGLADAEQQVKAARQAEEDGEVADLEPTKALLQKLGPTLDGLMTLVRKIEDAAPGPDANKIRRDAENLINDFEAISKDCSNQAKLVQTKNDLRNQFEMAVISAQKLLDNTRQSAGFNDGAAVKNLSKEKVKMLLDDLAGNWSKARREVESAGDKLKPLVDSNEIGEIEDTLVDLDRSFNELTNQLGLALDEMQEIEGFVGVTSQKGQSLKDEVNDLVDKITDLEPIGRDVDLLKRQGSEVEDLSDEIARKEDQVGQLAIEWNRLVDEGRVTSTQASTPLKELDQVKHRLEQQKKKLAQRKKQIKDAENALKKLETDAEKLVSDLDSLARDEIFTLPIAAELPELKRQQQTLKQLKNNEVKPLTEAVEDLVGDAKELIRSAGPDVPTKDLEELVKNVTKKLNEINSKIDERDRKIESAVQGLGSYNDAYKGLLNWIEETEELLCNQKPPSADYKVTKTQLQNLDFQVKFIDDKQSSVDGFTAMMDKVYALAQDDETRSTIKAKADDISTRYNMLVDAVNQRRVQLIEAAELGEEFANIVNPLSHWLDAANKEVQSLTSIPTNQDKLNEQIRAQEALLEALDNKRTDFDQLYSVYTELSKLVGPDDSVELESTVHSLTEKYNELGLKCRSLGISLTEMKESITSFLDDAEQLTHWLDEIEAEIEEFGDMSIYPAQLAEQSEKLAAIVTAVTEQQGLVSRVVQDSNELCMHTSGSEAVALQYRIENLRHRYSQISHDAEQKINAMTEAIPLSEMITSGFEEVNEFINLCEDDLSRLDEMPLEEQTSIIQNLEADMAQTRLELNDLNEKSMQLQHLSSKVKADELAKRTNELNRAFNNAHDKVVRKGDALNVAEKHSRKVFDDLDYLLDWFREAHDKIISSDKPAIDSERLKIQLKNQRMMNDDIATERASLREIVAAASRVARELRTTMGGQELVLMSKVEEAKKLAEDTTELGRDRLTDLEQAYALCSDLDDSFTDISDWLDQKDVELRSCEPINTGMSPEQLMGHKTHNNQMLQAYRDQKPMIFKFEKNVNNLAELCSPDDAHNLQEIANSTVDRFREQEEEWKQRGRVLDETIEQSSVFGDRLDTFLSNLESANNKIRNPDPVSARPPVIQRQINDNAGVVAVFHQKEDAFKAMKDDANAILAQSTPGDPAASEVAQKVNALDTLWFEIQDGLDRRQNFLEDTLGKADRFWAELEQCQKAVNGLRKNLDSIHMTAADPQKLEENKVLLYTVEQGIVDTTPKMDSLRHAGHTLAANVGDDEKHNLEHQLVGIERDWATVTQIYAQMSNNLVDAMSKSMNFHELLRQLLLWLTQAEGEVSQLPQVPATNVEDIYAELKKLEGIRQQIDDKAVLREQLNQAADELYANAHPSQVNAVRAPMNELNSRWNKLYALINDRQQRLEKALLELGQFEQACQQLFSWIERTDRTLEEIQPSCRDLKQIEIELCKLKVIQNDIQSHGPSLEAILKAGKSMIKTNPESAAETGQKIENLSALWAGLNQKCHNLWNKLDVSKADASNRDGEYDRWALWVEDLLSELSYSKPIGGLPETAQSQLDDFSIITADVEEKRPKIESEIRRLVDQVDANPSHPETAHIQQKHDEMKKNWTRLNEKLFDKQKKLQIALHDAEALSEAMQDMTRWLDKAENHLSNLPLVSRMLEPLEKQIDEHQLFVANVSAQRETMSDLNTRGTKIQFTCEKKDAIPIKNRLISLKHRFDKVVNRTADRSKSYDNALGESQAYFKACNELLSFLDRIDQTLKENDHIPNDSATGDRLRIILEENKQILEELFARKPVYESTEKRGKQLEDHAPAGEKTDLHAKNAELIKKWKSVNADALSRQRSIEDALVASGKFDEALGESFKWLNSVLPNLESEVKTGKFDGDLDTLTLMSNDHHDLMQEMKRRKAGVEQLRQRAGKIMETPETSDKEKTEIQDNLEKLNDEWTRLEAASKNKDLMITEGLRNAVDLDEMLQDLNFKAAEVESKLKRIGTLLPDDEGEIQELLKELAVFTDDVKSNKKPEVEKAVVLGQQMQQNAHPKTDQNLRNILRGLSGRWDTIDQSILDKDEKLKKHLAELREHEKKMDGLDDFIGSKETALEFLDAEGEAQNLPQVDNMQAEHDMFKQELSEKQPEVDEVLKVARKHASKSESAYPDDQKDPSTPTTPTSRNAPPKPLSRGNTKLKILQDKPRRSRRQQKADLVSDKWKKLWEHTTDYDNKLKARREYLEEMKRLEGFTFDDWRERYLQWNDTGKARISDLFRRIDTSRTGIIPREAFIKGILNSKFPTTHLEMVKVSDEFDKGDGMISAKEFMNALRYDPKKRQPQKTEAEIIHEELRKETERCTCSHRFPITHLNTNNNNVQYGFGFGSTMKRMVRILRSTVMVRVGGGWERLDEFLSKHDPCRAAGRTNVHLHNVPENALDQMHEFKSRRSAAHSHSGNSSLHGSREVLSYVGAPGPISKIREKTDRSVPMFKKPATPKTSITGPSPLASYSTRRASDLAYNPDSKIPRPSPSVSRSSSRQNISSLVTPVTSRPQSRMSEDSDERPPSRIPSFRTPKGTRYQPGNNRF